MRAVCRALVLFAFGVAAGCDPAPDKVRTYPVSGQVVYDGKPAAGVRVFLYPTAAPTVPTVPANPHGMTAADGRFTLSTYGDGDGAAEGSYQVILLWPPDPTEEDEEARGDRLFGWYSAVNSKLAVEVHPGDNPFPPFQLPARKGPPPKSEGVPGRN